MGIEVEMVQVHPLVETFSFGDWARYLGLEMPFHSAGSKDLQIDVEA
jgi:hypothetical protein